MLSLAVSTIYSLMFKKHILFKLKDKNVNLH